MLIDPFPNRRSRLAFAIILALGIAISLHFRRTGGDRWLDNRPLVSDLDFAFDSLANGLHYYVSAYQSRTERTELRLIVAAGSVEEDEDQRGLAHAVEHMLFRGTRQFPHETIDRYFESLGMRDGDDVNAVTSTDKTVYRMSIPDGRPGAIDTALAMLASMAHEANFDPSDAEREAGVLLEEWRMSRRSESREREARNPLLLAGTPYAARPVIGDTAVLRRFDLGAMRRYYEKWYKPELMGVVVVGDFDAKDVAAKVRRYFGVIPQHTPRQLRPTPNSATAVLPLRATILTDPEAWTSSLEVWYARRRHQYRTAKEYRDGLIAMLWSDVLAGRLEDAVLQPDSPISAVGVDANSLTETIAADVVSVTAMKGRTLPALDVTVSEMRELARSGPAAEELDERRRALLRGLRERGRVGDNSADVAQQFVDHFAAGDVPMTSSALYELTQRIVPSVGPKDIQEYAKTRIAGDGSLIVLAATPTDSVGRLPADAIVSRAQVAHARSPIAASERIDVEQLIKSKPKAGRIAAEDTVLEVRVYQWTLSNGMHVLLKPTSFDFDEVQIRLIAPGGASLASDNSYPSAYLSDAIIRGTGVGRIPGPRLRRWLRSSSISLTPSVSDDAITFDGTSSTADLERLFQLLHLYLTEPRGDTAAFQRYQARAVSNLADRGRDPDAVFDDSVAMVFTSGDPRALTQYPDFYERARLSDALDFWNARLSNAAGMTVAIAGDFSLARARPLVERYLASLPQGRAELPTGHIPSANSKTNHEIAGGTIERSRTAIGFSRPFELSNENMTEVSAVRDVVEHAVSDRLRSQMGGTYDVDASVWVDVAPPVRYGLNVEFESAPDRMEALAAAALDELKRLQRNGPTEAEFRSTRESRIRDFDGEVNDNSYWVREMTTHARYGWPIAGIGEHVHEAQSMTLETLREACATYLAADGYVRVTMRPSRIP